MGYEPGWYEEDCCAYAVMLTWPQLMLGDEASDERVDEWLQSLLYWVGYDSTIEHSNG
jgi:hypothetical protein